MNKRQVRFSYDRGVVFGIVLIFLTMIGFDVMAGTIISKVLGTQVLRGALPEGKFVIIFFILLGLWAGGSASKREDPLQTRGLGGLISGAAMGVIAAVFGLVLNALLVNKIDLRTYLPQISFDNIKLYLMIPNISGIFALLGLFTLTGGLGGLLAAGLQSEAMHKARSGVREWTKTTWSSVQSRSPLFVQRYGKYVAYLLLAVVILIMPLKWGSYWNYVIGTVGLYVIAGLGLNVIVGLSGQLILGYAAFFAMGAYAVALLNSPMPHNLMWGFWISLVMGILVAIIAGILLGLPTMRLRGDYLAIVTLGFGEIIRILLKSDALTNITGGPRGVQDIRGPSLFGKPLTSDSDYMYMIIVAVAIAVFVYMRLQNSRTGRAWLAVKEDEIAARATGINVQNYKLLALCVGAAFAGLAGGIFAARNQFTGPDDHGFMVSVNVLSLVIVGGMNSVPGIILGAFTLKGLPEILREFESYRLLAFGGLLVLMMLIRPDGLWPAIRPNLEEKGKKASSSGGEGSGAAPDDKGGGK